MERFCLDSSAWMEYFQGTAKGARLKKAFLTNASFFTPVVVLTEIGSKAIRNNEDFSLRLQTIKSLSTIVPTSEKIAVAAAGYKAKHRPYALDALVYASAIEVDSILLSEDWTMLPMKGVKSLRQL
ncbi:MAG: PIN domain-containing protein [Candidatus Micrarchaeota archaeon]